MYVGEMVIDSRADDWYRCESTVYDPFAAYINPYEGNYTDINLIANCSILNERYGKTDIWQFEIETWGDDCLGGLIETVEIDDTLNPWETPINFQINVSVSLTRSDFEKRFGTQGPESKSFYVNLKCRYICNFDGIDEDDSDSSDPYQFVVGLRNADPYEVSISGGPDNNSGSSGTSYTFTARCNGDPDGDSIKYHFGWGDGNSGYESSEKDGTTPSSASASHTWTLEERGSEDFTVYVWVQDDFGAQYWNETTIIITKQKSKSLSYTPLLLNLLEAFPKLKEMIERLDL
jgi:hypothetical protein